MTFKRWTAWAITALVMGVLAGSFVAVASDKSQWSVSEMVFEGSALAVMLAFLVYLVFHKRK